MTVPILGSLMAVLLVGVILPERVGHLVSPVMQRSRETTLKTLGRCPYPPRGNPDQDIPSIYNSHTFGLVGVRQKQLDDGSLTTCASCHCPFSNREACIIWRPSADDSVASLLHVECTQPFVSLLGCEEQALSGAHELERSMEWDPMRYRTLRAQISVVVQNLKGVMGLTAETELDSDGEWIIPSSPSDKN